MKLPCQLLFCVDKFRHNWRVRLESCDSPVAYTSYFIASRTVCPGPIIPKLVLNSEQENRIEFKLSIEYYLRPLSQFPNKFQCSDKHDNIFVSQYRKIGFFSYVIHISIPLYNSIDKQKIVCEL